MSTKRAELLMLFVTFCWGSSYLFMQENLSTIGPCWLLVWRFGIAFAAGALLLGRTWHKVNRELLRVSAIVGLLTAISFMGMVLGLEYTTTSNAGFMMRTMVIFIPFVERFVYHRALSRSILATTATACLGIACLTLHDGLRLNPGDLLCLGAALLNAIQVSYTSRLLVRMDPITIGVLQFGFTSLFGLVPALLFETPAAPVGFMGWFGILYLGLICSAFGFTAQFVAQKYTSAERIGILFCLEPVFATMLGVIVLHEPFGLMSAAGAALVLASVVLSGRSGENDTPQALQESQG